MSSHNRRIYPIIFLTILYIIRGALQDRISIPVDVSTRASNDYIDYVYFNGNLNIFTIKDRDVGWIGRVYYGNIMIMDDKNYPDEILERVVYMKENHNNYDYKNVITTTTTDINGKEYTDEYLVIICGVSISCQKIHRAPVLLDISRNLTLSNYFEYIYPARHWKGVQIVQKSEMEYRIGNIMDGEVSIVKDPTENNIRVRYVHMLRLGFMYKKLRGCKFLTGEKLLNVIRVYTYYYQGSRTFDEYVECRLPTGKVYVENKRVPVEVQFLDVDRCRYISKSKKLDGTFQYAVSDNFRHSMRLGRVINGPNTIIDDDAGIRVRLVETNDKDNDFKNVLVKTWYKVGDCKITHHHFVHGKYVMDESKATNIIKHSPTPMLRPGISCMDLEGSVDDPDSDGDLVKTIKGGLSQFGLETVGIEGKNTREFVGECIKAGISQLLGSAADVPVDACTIVIDISEPITAEEVIVETLPETKKTIVTVKQEYMENEIFLQVQESGKDIVSVNLSQASQLYFIIWNIAYHNKVSMMIHHKGIDNNSHEIFIINNDTGAFEYRKKTVQVEVFYI
ncbi:hypothetical protein BdWA1_002420 [Babesia duncani]|uniref:Uncharacterized protein n=1 Tax=Babesia duncani TaxID=323732 RepID=A0AAD9PJI3_9APIC|nr:hypothetical protein BdWA1_002420 [Babesia duncani]